MSEDVWGLIQLGTVFTALASFCGVVFAFATRSSGQSVKAMNGRIDDLISRIEGLEGDNRELRYQVSVYQVKIGDYARHVFKLELTMRNQGITPPEFEMSPEPLRPQ